MKYADAVLYGNLAYDLDAVPELQPEAGEAAREHELPRRRTREKVSVKTAAAPKLGLSPFTLVGAVLVLGLMFLMVMSYVSLNSLSETSAAYQKELAELQDEEERLKIKYEGAIDLDQIEQYAMAQLGMVKAEKTQIAYVSSAKTDEAEILSGETKQNIFQRIGAFLSRFAEYF